MKQLKLGIILNYLSIILTFIIGLIYTPFLIRFLGQEDYGIYALAFAIAGYLSLLDLGVGNSIVRFISANMVNGTKENERKIIGFFFKVFTYIGILTLAIGGLIAINTEKMVSSEFSVNQIEELRVMIWILTLNFAIGFVFNTFAAVIQAYERFVFLKICNILRQLLTPLISVVILFYSSSLILLTLTLFIVNTGILIVNFIYYKKYLNLKLSFDKLNIDFKKEIVAYSAIIFIVAVADKLYWQTDQILLGIIESPSEIAIYAVAIQFINIFMSLSIAINSVFLPRITKLVNTENYLVQLNQLYIKVSKFQTFIVGLAFSGFIIIGKDFIVLWVGESYTTVYVITLILVSTFFLDLIQNLGLTIMQAEGKYKFRAYTLIICSILNVLISIPIIKIYGSIGTAVVTAIFVLIGNVIILNVYFHKVIKLNMKAYWSEIGRFLIVISLITVSGYFSLGNIEVNNWFTLFGIVTIYSILYCLGVFIFYLSKKDRGVIINLIKNRFVK